MSFPRLWKVLHHDGFGGPTRFDPPTLQFPVRADVSPPARGGELYCRSLLHGNLQRESSRPVGPQRVKPIMYCLISAMYFAVGVLILQSCLPCSCRSRQALRVREHKVLGPYVDGLSRLAVESYKVKKKKEQNNEHGIHFVQSPVFIIYTIVQPVMCLFILSDTVVYQQ